MASQTWSRSSAAPADDVQDRPEDFAFEARDAVDLVGARREEGAVAGGLLVERAGEDRRRETVEPAGVRGEYAARRLVDHRADVGGEVGRVADAQFLHRAGEHFADPVGDVGLDEQHAQAEQRCPAELNAEATTSRTICSGSADESAISVFWPPVSAISGTSGPSLPASVRAIRRATSVEPVNATPAHSRPATIAAPMRPSPGRKASASAGCRRVQQLDGQRGDQRRLLGRFGDDRVAGGQGRGDLADKDGQREIPGTDADEYAAAVQRQAVALAGRAGQGDRLREFLAACAA
jgi:hypothetical protein